MIFGQFYNSQICIGMYCSISTSITLFRVKNVRKNIEVQFWFFYFANEEILVGGKKFNIKKYFEF